MKKEIDVRILKELRELAGKSQNELAREAKITQRQLQRIENCGTGRISVREDTLVKLAKALRTEQGVLTGAIDRSLNPPEVPAPEIRLASQPIYRHRLLKLGDELAIAEFTGADDVGRIVARGIADEKAGLRLACAGDVIVALRKLLQMAPPCQDEHDAQTFYEADEEDARELIETYDAICAVLSRANAACEESPKADTTSLISPAQNQEDAK